MAGRRPGSPKTGGRVKGTLNSRTREQIDALRAAEREVTSKLSEAALRAMTPVDVMYMAMRAAVRAGDTAKALAAAVQLAPYCHARLSSMVMEATIKRSIKDFSTEELEALARGAVSDPDAVH